LSFDGRTVVPDHRRISSEECAESDGSKRSSDEYRALFSSSTSTTRQVAEPLLQRHGDGAAPPSPFGAARTPCWAWYGPHRL